MTQDTLPTVAPTEALAWLRADVLALDWPAKVLACNPYHRAEVLRAVAWEATSPRGDLVDADEALDRAAARFGLPMTPGPYARSSTWAEWITAWDAIMPGLALGDAEAWRVALGGDA